MDNTYLVFGHRGARYGLDARAVREIVWLPELSPIEELPPYIAGVFNLRGRIVPVIDLSLRFGHAPVAYLTGDHVIVLESGKASVGVIVNELLDVLAITPAEIEEASSYHGAGGQAQFVLGEAKLDDGLAMLLDVDALLCSAPSETALSAGAPPDPGEGPAPSFGKLSAEDIELYRSRARRLAPVQKTAERAGLRTFAVIRLDDELFGLELEWVREFAHLRKLTPVPCCPPHIIGNMNLRGDILTLADIRTALGMTTAGALKEVVVVRTGALLMGLPATEIVEVVHLAPEDIASIPVASDRAGKAYCKGVATVGGRAVGLLDLEKMVAARELQVAEEAE